ncbi:MAG: DUF5777 family beta-barrel protein [Candidatus Sulfotelmatobacter sp.]
MCWKSPLSKWSRLILVMVALTLPELGLAQGPVEDGNKSSTHPGNVPATVAAASDLGISFIDGSTSQVLVERNGRQYIVDLATHAIRETETSQPVAPDASQASNTTSPEAGSSSSKDTAGAAQAGAGSGAQASAPSADNKNAHVYTPGDDLVFTLPTGRRLESHGLYINFTHRFPYEAAFKGTGRGDTLFGLDDFSISSFGFRYGVTSKLSVMAYRSPSIIGRPIELMAAYNFLDESDGKPFNAAVRFSVDGQNDFSANFTENIELALSRSLGHRAQLYAVPTLSIHNRPLLQNPGGALQDAMPQQSCSLSFAAGINPSFNVHPCENTFSLGVGAAVDIRPTVALVAEAIPTLMNGPELGIHRSPFSFGIKKKIWRHAFTLGFSNSPGTIVSNRAGTNATFLQQPGADKPSGVFIGFDLTRQTY